MDTEYFLRLLQFVGQQTRERTTDKRKALTEERRVAYKKEDWTKYEEIIKKSLELEDQYAQTVLKEVIEVLEISEQEFGMTHQLLASNPQTAEYVMAAQQGKLAPPSMDKVPKISKSNTLKAFEVSQELTMKQMERLKNQPQPDSSD